MWKMPWKVLCWALYWARMEKRISSMFSKLEEKKTLLTLCVATIGANRHHSANLEIAQIQNGVGDALKELLARGVYLRDDQVNELISKITTANCDRSVTRRQIDSIQEKIPLLQTAFEQLEVSLQHLKLCSS